MASIYQYRILKFWVLMIHVLFQSRSVRAQKLVIKIGLLLTGISNITIGSVLKVNFVPVCDFY